MSNAAYSETNATLTAMANGDSSTADSALAAGAAEIDEAFASGGYVTPLDLSALDAGYAKTRLVARLADVNRAIAAYILSSPATGLGKKGSSDKVEKDYKRARAWLDKVSAGEIAVPPLVQGGGGATGGMATGVQVVGDSTYPDTDKLLDRAFCMVRP